MSGLWVAPIVEGHGEVGSIGILLRRIGRELLGREDVQIIQPFRVPRGQLVQEENLKNKVRAATLKLASRPEPDDHKLVLILIDADADCPAQMGPKLLAWACDVDRRFAVSCVLANVEYETWFVAAAESLSEYLDLTSLPDSVKSPEEAGHKKAWIEHRFLVRAEGQL